MAKGKKVAKKIVPKDSSVNDKIIIDVEELKKIIDDVTRQAIDNLSEQLSHKLCAELSLTNDSDPKSKKKVSKKYTDAELKKKKVPELKELVRTLGVNVVSTGKGFPKKQDYIDAILGESKPVKKAVPVTESDDESGTVTTDTD